MTYSFKRFVPVFFLAALLFSGCPQSQDAGLKETPTLPQTPQNLTVKPGNQRLIVSWDQAAGANSYELVFWGDDKTEVSREENAAMAAIGGLVNGKTYWVKVRSKNNAGISAFTSAIDAAPALQAPAPSVISGDAGLSVGWAAEDGVEYELWYGTTDNSAAAVKWNGAISVLPPVAGTTITGLVNGNSYYLWIRVPGDVLTSDSSRGTPAALSVAPQGFVYVPGGTVVGNESYTMNVRVPVDPPGYMNAGKTLSKKGVFTENRTVEVNSFLMAKYETTQQLWYDVQSWAEGNGYSFQNTINAPESSAGPEIDINKPVTGISWRDAIVWCNAYSEMSGLEVVYSTGNGLALRDSRNGNGAVCDDAVMDRNKNGYRLPTEAEREYAARGGDPGKADWMYLFAGSNDAEETTWHHGNSAYQVKDVGLKKENRLGIFDLSGNAQEWGWDWMNYSIAVNPETPPDGELYNSRFNQKPMAGGGVGSNLTMACVADRWSFDTNYADPYVGFRLVRRVE